MDYIFKMKIFSHMRLCNLLRIKWGLDLKKKTHWESEKELQADLTCMSFIKAIHNISQ